MFSANQGRFFLCGRHQRSSIQMVGFAQWTAGALVDGGDAIVIEKIFS
jgi:hypothetical protein